MIPTALKIAFSVYCIGFAITMYYVVRWQLICIRFFVRSIKTHGFFNGLLRHFNPLGLPKTLQAIFLEEPAARTVFMRASLAMAIMGGLFICLFSIFSHYAPQARP